MEKKNRKTIPSSQILGTVNVMKRCAAPYNNKTSHDIGVSTNIE